MEVIIENIKVRENADEVKPGEKGYAAKSFKDLICFIKEKGKSFYIEIKDVNPESTEPFISTGGNKYSYFYSVEKPKEKKYRPYTWEEREQLRGKWVKYLNYDKTEKEFQIIKMELTDKKEFFVGNGINPSTLLEACRFIDGTPCGVLVEDYKE